MAVVVVHVDDSDVRRPISQGALGLKKARDGSDDEQAVVEGELDQIGDKRAIV